MKNIITLALISILYGCTSTPDTFISYSPYFKIKISSQDLRGATFFKTDSVSVKFSNSIVLSGLIIDKELESLPLTFDIHDYPEYSLGLKSLDDISQPYSELFRKSWEETKRVYGNPSINKKEKGNVIIYTACGNNACLSFLVNKDMTDHILMLSAQNIQPSQYEELLKGI